MPNLDSGSAPVLSIASLVARAPLRLGATGDAVRRLQTALKGIGYQLTGTGYFGTLTDTAVESFQKRAGLKVDGVVGPKTGAAIDAAMATPPGTPVTTASDRPLWLEAGLNLLGTKEVVGARDNPVIINWAKDEGGSIAKEYTHDSIPWCALFANHCLTRAGIKGTGTLWALDFAGKWPSIKIAGPAVGAFAPMLRNGGGHITIVVGRDQHGNIMGLGGNQSDAVTIAPFAMSRLNKGFWWPAAGPPAGRTGVKTLPIVRSDGRVSSNES
jgi:uncharacterized protein (TIGR02594 family)